MKIKYHLIFAVVSAIILISLAIYQTYLVLTKFSDFHKYDYAIVIESGYHNSTFHLYRWNELIEKTGKAECAERCTGELILNQNSQNISALDSVLSPCLTKFESNYRLKTQNRSLASPLFFIGTGQLRLLALKSPQLVDKLLEDVSVYLNNKTKFNVRDVALLNGTSEGLFSWIAGNVHQLESSPSAGSSDVVIELNDETSVIAWNVKNESFSSGEISNVQLFGNNYTIKSASDMCFGSDLAKSRLTILLIKDHQDYNESTPIADPCLLINSTRIVDSNDLLNDCLELKSASIKAARKYLLTGKGDPEKCSDLIREVLEYEKCNLTFKKCLSKTEIPPKNSTVHAMSDYLLPMSALHFTDHKILDYDYFNQTHITCKLTAEQLKGKISDDKVAEICFRLSYNYWMIKEVHQITDNWDNIVWDTNLKSRWPLGMAINATTTMSGDDLRKFPDKIFRRFYCWFTVPTTILFLALIVRILYRFRILTNKKKALEKEYEALQQQAM